MIMITIRIHRHQQNCHAPATRLKCWNKCKAVLASSIHFQNQLRRHGSISYWRERVCSPLQSYG